MNTVNTVCLGILGKIPVCYKGEDILVFIVRYESLPVIVFVFVFEGARQQTLIQRQRHTSKC